MRRYLDQPLIVTQNNAYLSLLIVLAPLLNFLSGISIDMYAPSMPAITHYFATTTTATKNTITLTVIGWTVGCVIFGAVIDALGRKRTLLCGIFIYMLLSFLAPRSHTIYELMIFCFVQGLMLATIGIGCRALVVDNFSGRRYTIAILYTSIAWGTGPIIGPFIGGIIQHSLGWQANFVVLGIVAGALFLITLCFLRESVPEKQPLAINAIAQRYFSVLKHKQFIAGVIIGGLVEIELLLYPTLGPFVVENVLQRSVLVYGNTALVIGASYLGGTLINRFLLQFISPRRTCQAGFLMLLAAVISAYAFVGWGTLNLMTLVVPIMLLGVGNGLIFPNVLAANLRQFPQNAGVAMAVQGAVLLFIAAVGVFIISHVNINNLLTLALIYTLLVALMIMVFAGYQKLLEV